MDTAEIRQKLSEYIKVADDEKVGAIYTLVKDELTAHYEWWHDDDLIAELDRRSADLKSGKDPGFSLEESKERIKAILAKND